MGSAQEGAAFIAFRLDRRTVREVGQAIGVSKSQVPNLADLFQEKLATRMTELRRKRIAVSAEYQTLYRDLYGQLHALFAESGSDDDWWGGQKIGSFNTGAVSREDWAEVTGAPQRARRVNRRFVQKCLPGVFNGMHQNELLLHAYSRGTETTGVSIG